MDIKDWPLGKIMQLPDCCFGRRFLVCAERSALDAPELFDISEMALPEMCVLWQVILQTYNGDAILHNCRVALGDQLPTSTAMLDTLEPLVPGLGVQGAEPRDISIQPGSHFVSMDVRQLLQAMGRRLVVGVRSAMLKETFVRVVVVVSSIPTEVPDWLCSGNLRSL